MSSLLIAMLSLALTVQAPHNERLSNDISVRVIDMTTQSPIAKAAVSINGEMIGYTDEDGHLERGIHQSAPDVIEISSSKVYYITSKRNVTLKSQGTRTTIRLFNQKEIKNMQRMFTEKSQQINDDLLEQINSLKSAYPDFDVLEEFEELRKIESDLLKFKEEGDKKKQSRQNKID